MFEVRLHGRGGQGVVTGATLLSVAAFIEGLRAQAFPSFGSERMGAPVVSYCRIARSEIRLREPVLAPDGVIVQDPTLLHSVDVFGGLAPDGYVLINSTRSQVIWVSLPSRRGCRRAASSACRPPRSRLSIWGARFRTPPCSAGSRASPDCSASSRWRRPSPNTFHPD